MIVELFCCSGGMAEGFRRAGLSVDIACDASPDACDSYEANLGHRPICIDVRDVLRLATADALWQGANIDLLLTDPPCTPWSRAGHRLGTDDPRDMLRTTCDLIAWWRPTRFLIGNVPGLDDNDNWLRAVQPIIGSLSTCGYAIEYCRLDAADYGVPQHRERPFWFGHIGGPPVAWPEPTHGAPPTSGQTSFDPLTPWVTCRQALGHLPAKDLGREVVIKRRAQLGDGAAHGSPPDAPARTQGASHGMDGNILATRAHHRIATGDTPARVITAARQDDAQLMRWPWDRPATTVQRDERLAPPGHHDRSFMSDDRAVILSEIALTILQGFPESWQWLSKTKTGRQSMRGQAMPPPLAEAVARSVRAQMEAT